MCRYCGHAEDHPIPDFAQLEFNEPLADWFSELRSNLYMFKNNLLLVLRGLKKDPGFSTINLVGLAIGLGSCLLIMLFITHELSYEKGYDKADNIYRVIMDATIGGDDTEFAIAPFAALPSFQADIPSVLGGVRVMEWDGQVVVDGVNFEEQEILMADTSYFELFSADFISGIPETALDQPGSVVITASTADKLFGSLDVMGKPLSINDTEMNISGVVEDPTVASHLYFDYLVSIMNRPAEQRENLDSRWYNIGMWTYLLMPEGVNTEEVEQKMADVLEQRAGDVGRQVGIQFIFGLQPLKDIHLTSQRQAEFGANGNLSYVYAFSIIAIFILLIACVNFANLSTARSTMRAKEVGVRKAVGANQTDLVGRFMTESLITVLLSMALALLFTVASLGWMNSITGKELSMISLVTPAMIGGTAALLLFCTLIAGAYPAFVLSSLKPVAVLRGQIGGLSSKSITRRGLVVLQFSVSIILIIGTLIVSDQIEFMKNKPLGFDKEAVAVIQMDTSNDRETWESFRQQLLQQSSITLASFASGVPGNTGELRLFVPEGRDSSETLASTVTRVDHDFADTYGMELAAGRFYSRDFPSDTSAAFVINQAAAASFGWDDEEAIGKSLEWRGVQESNVIGVVSDYHYEAVTQEIAPLVIALSSQPNRQLTVRFARDAEVSGVDAIRSEWSSFESQRPLDITFVDEDLASRYSEQETAGDLVSIFAILAIFIAALGLFGLASFAVQRRTKEIGVRKVLGASSKQIIRLITSEFTSLLLIANLIAWPVGWYLISTYWMTQFPYSAGMSIVPFVLAGVLSLAVTLGATSFHSVSAANANPVDSLRSE
ncbi:MAG: ABC transporter permease [Rhodothermales bacterium]|nr:ABC transporter permease [Rhodothermales bacterium]